MAEMVKNLPAMQETQVWSLVGKIPWRREWQPTPLFWPGEFHGQRCLAGYSPWGHKESDITEQLPLYLFLNNCNIIVIPFYLCSPCLQTRSWGGWYYLLSHFYRGGNWGTDTKAIGFQRHLKWQNFFLGKLLRLTCHNFRLTSLSYFPWTFFCCVSTEFWEPCVCVFVCMCVHACVCTQSRPTLCNLWTVAFQDPLSTKFSRQEYWSGCHFLLHGIFLTYRLKLLLLHPLHWQADSLPLVPPRKPTVHPTQI